MKLIDRIAPYAAIIIVAGACLLLAYCTLREKPEPSHTSQIKAISEDLDANANIADIRVEDAVRAEQQQREIEDAVKNSTGPDDLRALRGCVILRQQGRDTSKIAACHP